MKRRDVLACVEFPFRIGRQVTRQIDILNAFIQCSYQRGGNMKLRDAGSLSRGLVVLSLFCLLLIMLLTLFYKSSAPLLPKQLAISVFVTICSFGAMAAVLPSKCSRAFHDRYAADRGSSDGDGSSRDAVAITLKGHHMTCGSFATHVLQVRGRTYCAGCSGLLTGALVAIATSLLYASNVILFYGQAGFALWFGFTMVLMGLLQYAKPLMTRGLVHFFLNVVFVVGAFFLLVGVIEMNGGFVVETYFLVVTLFWILTRMVLSNREHERICIQCGQTSCVYHRR